MRRRELVRFISQAMILPGALTACQTAAPGKAYKANEPLQFGLQLSTLNTLFAQDFEATLAAVADIGYRQVEFSAMGLMGNDPARVKEMLDAKQLSAPVGRVSPPLPAEFFKQSQEEMRAAFMQLSAPERFLDNIRYSLEQAEFFQQKYLNLPALAPKTFADIEGVLRNIDLLNRAGELCAAQGVLFGYHNHNWEFTPVTDSQGKKVVPYELMLEKTDANTVAYQLDSYWVVKAGVNLIDTLRRYPGRFSSCHLKDIDKAGAMADVGEGEIDFPEFVQVAKQSGARYFFVERDNPPEPMSTARTSFTNLSNMVF